MLRECDKKLISQEAVEKDPALFNELKSLYEGIIADVKSDVLIQAPNDEAHTVSSFFAVAVPFQFRRSRLTFRHLHPSRNTRASCKS